MAVDAPAPKPPEIAYAVWVRGQGWLQNDNNEPFGNPNREVAQSALKLYRAHPGEAKVVLVDLMGDMRYMQRLFLERERIADERQLLNRLWRWIHGILGHFNPSQSK